MSNKYKRPIGKAKKTGDTEAWPWERKTGFCQSDTHPWHVCLTYPGKDTSSSHHTLFTYADKQSAWTKAKELNKTYNKGSLGTYLRNWITKERLDLD